MRFVFGPRRSAVRRLSLIAAQIVLAAASARGADAVASGVVVDQSDQPLPRVLVRVVTAAGAESATTFSDEAGRFHVAPLPDGCRLDISLTGFAPATVPCSPSDTLRVVLHLAPVQETVIVTATRTEAPAAQVGASVTTFTPEDLARRRTPIVADLLRSSPGVMVVRAGTPGAVTSLFVRGGESNYNKVLLDGIPLNEPGGTFNFSNLTTDNLGRIELVRGAQSALFGSDAMSSVVQLFTKRPDRTVHHPQLAASLEGGTYHTVNGSASVAGASGRLEYALGVSRYATDNRGPNSDFENTTLSANVATPLGRGAILRFVGRAELGRTETPGPTAFQRPDLDAFFRRHDGVGGVTFDQQVTPAFRQRASYSVAASNQQSTNLIQDPPYVPHFGNLSAPFPFSDFRFDTDNHLRRHHASYQADIRLANDADRGSHLLSVVADWDGERATLEDRLNNTTTPASRDNAGVSIQHQAVWRRVVLTGGVRAEHNDSFGGATVPRGAAVFVAHEAGGAAGALGETRLHVAGGRGIKEPTIVQSFSPSPFFRGNPDLLPERSSSIEAGVEQRFAADRARVDVAWFDNTYRNLISTRTTDPVTFEAEYFNIGLTRARGVEISGDAAPVAPVRVHAGYTFLASEIVDSTSPSNVLFQPGRWLFRRPRHSGYVDVGWTRDRLGADLTGVFIGRFVDSDFASLQPPLVENPGRTTWDARLWYAMAPQVRVLLAIDNLTDVAYMEPLGYPALRRAVRAGLRVAF